MNLRWNVYLNNYWHGGEKQKLNIEIEIYTFFPLSVKMLHGIIKKQVNCYLKDIYPIDLLKFSGNMRCYTFFFFDRNKVSFPLNGDKKD